ncbi:glutaredoxin [Mesorhizobium sp.]|uniref:glutaredoxin n=1 Tax=Mesorhizobium sp. TaxID=1871066 RepID=UPI000FE373DF|nr:glutaredoxin [Mesorhizobium sp.]RWI35419.1 MAG: glutaredoxin [Mesorhizobium sp.]RWJ03517.1 MAG: glutaredoxin [Mesorhizobium sp.]RWJ66412.1 MAG: glutaredoxin [Mesorhizobium sp.]
MPIRTDRVEVYGRPGCSWCLKAVAHLKDFNVPHKYLDITDPGYRADMFARNPQAKTVPQIFVGRRLIGGHDDLVAIPLNQLQQMIGE